MSENKVNITRVINAPQSVVFNAWVNPEVIKKFMMPMEGTTVTQADVDPKIGGDFSLTMTVGGNDIPIKGKYLEYEEYKKLSFTWLSDHVSENSVVHITFNKVSDNETELNLLHTGLATEEQASNHNGGWNRIVDLLSTSVA